MIRWRFISCILATCAGCARPPAAINPIEPIGLEMMRVEPGLRQQRFNTLLSFESPDDLVFVSSEEVAVQRDGSRGHTGGASLLLPPGGTTLRIKLASLLRGRAFPGDWTLLGLYCFAEQPTDLTIAYETEGRAAIRRTVKLSPDGWTEAFMDITPLTEPTAARAPPGTLVLNLSSQTRGRVWIDDVLLLDNSRTLVAARSGPGGRVWSIRRRGFRILGNVPGWFNFALPTPEASPNGWVVEEANALRARFRSDGVIKWMTVYVDGRAMEDGQFRAMISQRLMEPGLAEQHTAPAELSVSDELGRVNRDSAGDADNDGYNERTGAYQVIAFGPRVELTMIPRTAALLRPVLEVAYLPQGKVLVTVEGRLVEHPIRLENGNVLVELPLRIERPTTVNFRVQ